MPAKNSNLSISHPTAKQARSLRLMPPGPGYNWLCVLSSATDILTHAAKIRAAQLPRTALGGRKRNKPDSSVALSPAVSEKDDLIFSLENQSIEKRVLNGPVFRPAKNSEISTPSGHIDGLEAPIDREISPIATFIPDAEPISRSEKVNFNTLSLSCFSKGRYSNA